MWAKERNEIRLWGSALRSGAWEKGRGLTGWIGWGQKDGGGAVDGV